MCAQVSGTRVRFRFSYLPVREHGTWSHGLELDTAVKPRYDRGWVKPLQNTNAKQLLKSVNDFPVIAAAEAFAKTVNDFPVIAAAEAFAKTVNGFPALTKKG